MKSIWEITRTAACSWMHPSSVHTDTPVLRTGREGTDDFPSPSFPEGDFRMSGQLHSPLYRIAGAYEHPSTAVTAI